MPALRFTAVAVTAVLAAAAAPAAVPDSAHASRYLSRAQASNVTKRFALRYVDRLYSARKASCWPTGRRHTSRNLRYAWTRWDCGWSIRVHDADGSIDRFSGELPRHRPPSRRQTPHAEKGAVRAGQGAYPGRRPDPGTNARAGESAAWERPHLTPTADEGGRHELRDRLRPEPHRQRRFAGRGVVLRADQPLRMCAAQRHQGPLPDVPAVGKPLSEPSPFHYQITREIYRANVYAEDLGTSVGFNTSIEPQSILSYDPFHPFRWLCSNRYAGLPACPASRTPIAYPTSGPPYPNPQ